MRVWKIGFIGFGNVGQGALRVLFEKAGFLRERYGFEFKVVGISDPVKGTVYDEGGLDLKTILELIERRGEIRGYPGGRRDIDSLWLAKSGNVDIIVEVTPTNIETGEPGLTHIRAALESGKHVVTTNKGPIAVAFPELKRLAEKKGVYLRFEGTVLSGTPAISLALEAMAGALVYKIEGIVNGTTNFILSKMEEGISYEEALKTAQRLGYAETDPTADVDGWDAAVKAVILANVVMNAEITIKDVERRGIRGITLKDVREALRRSSRIKLITEVYRERGKVRASVSPKPLPLNHPLANVMGATNALTFTTDHLRQVTIIGPGAGRIETGQAVLSDILAIHRYVTSSARQESKSS